MTTHYRCANRRRAALVAADPDANGIDYLEVVDVGAPSPDLRQRLLRLHLFKPAVLVPDNIRFEGSRARPVRLEKIVEVVGTLVTLQVREPGDFSTYTLRLIRARDDDAPPLGFDPPLAAVDFSFKVECPSDLDCAPVEECPPEALAAPLIDYLAKDYAGFRRLILDRLSTTMPRWADRNPADVLVMLVEALAYAADHLSYMQDAAATEMYLGTARLRSSVRRHARLLDYPLHEGTNARLWATFETGAALILPRGLPVLTAVADAPRLLPALAVAAAADAGAQVFELLADTPVFPANNRMDFHTWGDENCWLPRGATRATLVDPPGPDRLLLRPGDVLIFEEVTTAAGPAPRDHRCAVRLTRVVPEALPAVLVTEPALGRLAADGLPEAEIAALRGIGLAHGLAPIAEPDWEAAVAAALTPEDARRLRPKLRHRLPALYRTPAPPVPDALIGVDVVEIEWHPDDALPFPLCLSATGAGEAIAGMTSVWGNVAPADAGYTLPGEPLPPLPAAGPYRPVLAYGPLVHSTPYRGGPDAPARTFTSEDPAAALPSITLLDAGGDVWRPRRDLLASDRFAPEFVVEVEDDGRAALRFGGTGAGSPPEDGMTAFYRMGAIDAGNIGADRLAHIGLPRSGLVESDLAALRGVRNPLPAAGGASPEPIEAVRANAPQAFRRQERAVTSADYAAMAQRHGEVQRAMARRRWTGSWYTQFVSVDRRHGRDVDPPFAAELRVFLERFRLAGHDLALAAPRFVSLDIAVDVCVRPGSFAGSVHAALLAAFSARDLPSGRGFFHPDNFTFGQPVYLSRVVAAAMAVPGVDWVRVTRFRRWGGADDAALDAGLLTMGRDEIARLDNDPSALDNGRIVFAVREHREGTSR